MVTGWLTWPWRAVYRAAMRIGLSLPYAQLGLLLFPVVFAIAAVRLVQQDAPHEQVAPVLVLLVVLALAIFVHPLLDAALARAGERAADDYAAQLGAAAELGQAVRLLAPCRRQWPWERLRGQPPGHHRPTTAADYSPASTCGAHSACAPRGTV
ncbi:MAG: hypothetical protein M3500_17690 [Actinomycetota bacterium]|nr:hypothetical protein [Actinomycetota bacterium]